MADLSSIGLLDLGKKLLPSDYDMQGYIAKYGQPDQSGGQHLPDEFKMPRHITFSTESKYSKPGQEGGIWSYQDKEGNPIEENQKDGIWHFYASPFNVQMHGIDKLTNYFNNVEKDSVLHLPPMR